MSLLDPPADKARQITGHGVYRRGTHGSGDCGAVVYVSLLPGKKAAERFFDALVAGDTAQAYQLWKPSPTYALKDFLADWGPQGYYGPVKSYKVIHAEAPSGSNAIAVSVNVSPFSPMPENSEVEKSRKTKVVILWVLAADKSFSFPP